MKQHICRHNTRDLPQLHPGQQVLFLSPTNVNSYIEGTITRLVATPRSYMLEAQGRVYHCNRQQSTPCAPTQHPFQDHSHIKVMPLEDHKSTKISPFQDPPPQVKIAPLQDPLPKHSHKSMALHNKTLQNSQNKTTSVHYSGQPHQATALQPIALQTATLCQQVTFLPHTLSLSKTHQQQC